ncbi:unnamed protein product, partial [Symbiodinium pilosum]
RRTWARKGREGQDQSVDLRKLVEAAAKLTLKLADARQTILLDCSFTGFVGTEQGGVLPVMFRVSAEWKCLQESDPKKITRPLNVLMMERYDGAPSKADEDSQRCHDDGGVPSGVALAADMEQMAARKEVCFAIQTSLRIAGERLRNNLMKLCDNMVFRLLRSRLRQESRRRHGMAKHLERLLYSQPHPYNSVMLEMETPVTSMPWFTLSPGCLNPLALR